MRLTKRQGQVLAALATGLSHRGIGALLGIAPNTVDIHMTAVHLALGSASGPQAVAIAMRAHLLT